MTPLLAGLLLLFVAAAIVILLVARPRSQAPGYAAERLRQWGRTASERTDDAVRRRGLGIVERVELSGLHVSAGAVVLLAATAAAGAVVLGIVIALARPSFVAWVLPVVLPAVVVVGVRLFLDYRIDRRRAAFSEQLEGTLQLLASGLRAGHSLQRAVDSVSTDSASPTAEEFTRVINEHRLGRPLSDAFLGVAERMKSDDLAWTAQAVAIHREVGGNLSEVLDHVADTIRERQQIRRQVATLSSEGRVSAIVLMVLPVGVALLLSVVSPGYLSLFVTTPLGFALLGLCLILFIVGSLWLRSITRIRF
ncbi:tight adherence protein B [Microbacteriaceae bacterium SG_E_30_P1]|uniref:Tight adherence protein B n=1 Tax=Antiquaquibacter oligotrophicus TaxID=2880260 RepID=A0ABT6KQP3_9MICO|nr:type II secretion system F family protein [Antiquaquibacter oligotrophicus]MDH6182300.1 tight adherence protein B [Antiquaquibacter oligotrophicus]UDF12045.1 type II secretion system F family protein [Antiquaquibacter oligotrophicus]